MSDKGQLWYSVPCNSEVVNPEIKVQMNEREYSVADDLSSLVEKVSNKDEMKEDFASLFLAASVQNLLSWKWKLAIDFSRETLRLSDDESVRDEALNISAAALAMVGENSKALGALQHAVEGEWNLKLQTNLAVIAISEDPLLAVEHMSYLVDGARTPEEQLLACHRAIALWRSTHQAEMDSEEEIKEQLPEKLLVSIYKFLESDGLSEEDFFSLGLFLTSSGSENILEQDFFEKSPHRTSGSAELIRLRAEDFSKYMENLIRISQREGQGAPWLFDEAESMVEAANSLLMNEGSEDYALGMSFMMLEQGLDCATTQRLLLRGLVAISLARVLSETQSPNEETIEYIQEAKRTLLLHSRGPSTEEEREYVEEVLKVGCNTLGFLVLRATQVQDLLFQLTEVRRRSRGFFGGSRLNYEQKSAIKGMLPYLTSDVAKAKQLYEIVDDLDIKNGLVQMETMGEMAIATANECLGGS